MRGSLSTRLPEDVLKDEGAACLKPGAVISEIAPAAGNILCRRYATEEAIRDIECAGVYTPVDLLRL
jgi:hypothetical protein